MDMNDLKDAIMNILDAPDSDEEDELSAVEQVIIPVSNGSIVEETEENEENEAEEVPEYRPTYTEETHQQRGTGLGTYGGWFRSWPTKEEFFKIQFVNNYNLFFNDDNAYGTIDSISERIPNYYLKNPRLLAIAYYFIYSKIPLKREEIKKALKSNNITDVLDANIYRYMLMFQK